MSNTPTEGRVATKGSSLTSNMVPGSPSEGDIAAKARSMTSSMVPGPSTEGDTVARGETVIVGSATAKDSTVTSPGRPSKVTARPGKYASKAARSEENNNTVVGEENNNTTVVEGRHKVPPQVIRSPSAVARKVGGSSSRGLSRGLRKGRAQQLNAVAQVVAEEAVRAVLDEHHGSASSPQAKERLPRDPIRTHLANAPDQQHVEQESQSAKLLKVAVKPTSTELLVFVKRPCQPRPRSTRCDELLPMWKTQALRDQAKSVLKGVRDEQLRQSAGALISLQLGEGEDNE